MISPIYKTSLFYDNSLKSHTFLIPGEFMTFLLDSISLSDMLTMPMVVIPKD
jgi:hypothetical protein